MSIKSPIPPTFLPVKIELNRSVIRVPIQFYSAPPGTETLIYHLMDLFISYLTPYNHAEWNLAFRKFSVLSYLKSVYPSYRHLTHLTANFRQELFRGSSVIIRWDSDSILQQHFGENHGNGCCYSIYFDISIIVWPSRLL